MTKCAELCKGMRVMLQGLVASPELNGRHGRLLDLDTTISPPRWLVRLEGESSRGTKHRLLPEKLVPQKKDSRRGRGRGLGRGRGRGRARDRSEAAAKKVLKSGCHVVVQGLVKQVELNGRVGRLLKWDSDVDPPRWHVQLKGDKEVIHRLRPDCLIRRASGYGRAHGTCQAQEVVQIEDDTEGDMAVST
eukprot:TRINITY_DN80692_c0_g1_i1.p1 TRINITY_DN80692_c0_g1~~TRINITY_DN80692_c0_g1_i1.p1  ORF type:complete len:190 (-),score=31.88 TRINITY_DN80692_c0_g1_i1:12-581(-)